MKLNLRTGLVITATVVVALIAVLMFAGAAQPMSDEGATAQAWVDALCGQNIDNLYALSELPAHLNKVAFRGEVEVFIKSNGVPQPCAAQVNYNLIRDLAVPGSLTGKVDRARYFGQVVLNSSGNDSLSIALWLYHEIGGQWRVWASFLGTTPEQPTAAGSVGSIFDTNGVTVGNIEVKQPAKLYEAENHVLIGVPVDFQTLARPWENYNAQLYVDQQRAQAITDQKQLPAEWQDGFLPSSGNYTPQNLDQTGILWFSTETVPKQMTLALTVQAPYSGTLQAAYLDVPVAAAVQVTPFNPFKDMRFVEISRENPTFELTVDTTGLTADNIQLQCNRFVLVLMTDEWKNGTDCSFPQNDSQTFLPDERSRVQVTFAGNNIDDPAQLKAVMYRRGDDNSLVVRYDLWKAGEGAATEASP